MFLIVVHGYVTVEVYGFRNGLFFFLIAQPSLDLFIGVTARKLTANAS